MPTMNKEQVTAAIEDALDQGGHIIIRFGTDRMRTLKAEESEHILAAMKAAGSNDVARESRRLQWLEEHSTLHKRVDILYVVDGYEVQIVHEDGVTNLSPAYRGETLAEAIDNAISNNSPSST